MVSKTDTKFKKGNKIALGNSGPPPRVWTQERAEIEAKNLLEFAKRDTSLTMMGFYAESEGIDYEVSRTLDKFPVWKEAKRKAMSIIGNRRETFGLLGKYDSGIVKKAMGLYCHEFRDYEKELKTASTDSENAQPIPVRIVDYSK